MNLPPVGVEKVNCLCDTPIPIAIGTPRGDLLKSSDLKSPPWGGWGCKRTYSTAPKEGGEFMRIEKRNGI